MPEVTIAMGGAANNRVLSWYLPDWRSDYSSVGDRLKRLTAKAACGLLVDISERTFKNAVHTVSQTVCADSGTSKCKSVLGIPVGSRHAPDAVGEAQMGST